MFLKRYCLAVDLVNDPQLIAEYESYHRPENQWPKITQSIKDAGIINMEIYRIGNRMFMVMDTDESFSFERKAAMDAANPKVQEWEQLMWKYQQKMPFAKLGEKWVLMDMVYKLKS